MAFTEMTHIGNVAQFAELSAIYQAIINKQPNFQRANGQLGVTRQFSSGTLCGADLDGVRYIEQNPQKSSAAAARARAGHRIVWIIRGDQWIGRIEDGEVFACAAVAQRLQQLGLSANA